MIPPSHQNQSYLPRSELSSNVSTDKIMRYAVIAVSSIEQQYKGIKTKMKNEGKDVTEMNAEMKEAAIRLLENLAAIDEYSLTDQDKASLGDIVETALEMFINKR